ncbi:MAG: glucose 1-dehydrogenase [Candidatus Atribacteria bacterium]|nr:glucose 1-dehydrogenase [Candidatus Atribacteria bacterium]
MNVTEKYFDLSGKVAMVTGASKGLGRVFARTLAEGGASLIIIGRDQERLQKVSEEIEGLGRECVWYSVDITDEKSMETMVKSAVEKMGRIDILVNNAAAPRINIPLEDTTLEQWNYVMDNNVTGTFICTRQVGKQMIRQKKGKIINIASMAGYIMNKGTHVGSYDCSKHTMVAFTRALAVEWAPYNILVNALAPGYFLTDPNREFFEKEGEFYKRVVEMTPLRRVGNPEELASPILFLASDSNTFMTGSVLMVDGGYTLY